jgi:hypothetical protein
MVVIAFFNASASRGFHRLRNASEFISQCMKKFADQSPRVHHLCLVGQRLAQDR